MSAPQFFSLEQVALKIQQWVDQTFKSTIWVKAEINKVNFYRNSGHAFPELVEKRDGKVVAEMRSMIWNSNFARIQQNFINTVGEPLKDGITVLLQARITFSPIYGLSLEIADIDPAFTLGELEREKLENIKRLKLEGLFSLNKQVPKPFLPKRIAAISIETSKGYSDFYKVISQNAWGYRFEITLFPAILQGEKAAPTIMAQLDKISTLRNQFDVVAIIRGGGGEVGLTCYNNYELSKAIALCPLPVYSGIGHSTNETVAEMVSFRNAITPTELADFLIQAFHDVWVPLQTAQETLLRASRDLLGDAKDLLLHQVNYLKMHAKLVLQMQKSRLTQSAQQLNYSKVLLMQQREKLESILNQLPKDSKRKLEKEQDKLAQFEKTMNLLNPNNLLKRGYSLTYVNGQLLTSLHQINLGDTVTTNLADASFESEITQINPNKK